MAAMNCAAVWNSICSSIIYFLLPSVLSIDAFRRIRVVRIFDRPQTSQRVDVRDRAEVRFLPIGANLLCDSPKLSHQNLPSEYRINQVIAANGTAARIHASNASRKARITSVE